jgi:hypothetical protein
MAPNDDKWIAQHRLPTPGSSALRRFHCIKNLLVKSDGYQSGS